MLHLKTAVGLIGLAATLTLTACGDNQPESFAAGGSITVDIGGVFYSNQADGTPCVSARGYDDVSDGSQVVIASDSGKTLAIGRLGAGVSERQSNGVIRCHFDWSVQGVPTGEKFYQ